MFLYVFVCLYIVATHITRFNFCPQRVALRAHALRLSFGEVWLGVGKSKTESGYIFVPAP